VSGRGSGLWARYMFYRSVVEGGVIITFVVLVFKVWPIVHTIMKMDNEKYTPLQKLASAVFR